MAFLEPVTLTGGLVVLEPLTHDHHDGLVEAARDGKLWELWYTSVPRPEDMRAEIERRLGEQLLGDMLLEMKRPAEPSSLAPEGGK